MTLAPGALLLPGGTVVGVGLTLCWVLIAPRLVGYPNNDTSFVAVLAGVACLCGLGLAALADRRTRAFGFGLVLGAVGAVVVLFMLLLSKLGS